MWHGATRAAAARPRRACRRALSRRSHRGPVRVPRTLARATVPVSAPVSKRGQQYQSIVPSVPTRATVCRSAIGACRAIGGWRARCAPGGSSGRDVCDQAAREVERDYGTSTSFPLDASSRAVRERDARRTRAGARRRRAGSCPGAAARAAHGSPPDTARHPSARRRPLRVAVWRCRSTSAVVASILRRGESLSESQTAAIGAHHSISAGQSLCPSLSVSQRPNTTSLPPGRSPRNERSEIGPRSCRRRRPPSRAPRTP
jgi:hypothetical protein